MNSPICGFHVGRLSKYWQFVIFSGGIFLCYLINGFVSEAIFRVPGFQTFGWFLTLFQYFFYIICSYSEVQREEKSSRVKVPLRSYIVLALLTVLTMGMSNASVGYMNYPTQLVFKSCKVPFVMFGAVVLQGKRYDLYDFSAAFSMTSGLVCFTLVDSTVSPKFETKNFSDVVPLLVLFSASGYLGINFVLALIVSFGAVWAVTVTTLRKAITICLSFIIFEKSFSFHYLWSGFFVILGIYMNSHKMQFVAFCKVLNRRCKLSRFITSFLLCRQKVKPQVESFV